MQARRGDEHDLIAWPEALPEDRLGALRQRSDRRSGQLDVVVAKQARERRRLASPPRAPRVHTRRCQPAISDDARSLRAYHCEEPVAK